MEKDEETKKIEEIEQTEELKKTEPDVETNNDWKKHPLTQKLTAEVSALRKAEDARKEREKKEKQEQELKAAEDAKNYEEVIRILKTEKETEIARLREENQKAQLHAALAQRGFSARAIKLLAAEYNADSGSIEDYATACSSDDANKIFLANVQGRTAPAAPVKAAISGNQTLTVDQLQRLEKSENVEERKQWRDYVTRHYQKYGKMPY